MGLNESYGQIRGEVLLMDPIPPISRVFSLILQEEKQRVITNSATASASQVAFVVRNTFVDAKNDAGKPESSKKDQPLVHTVAFWATLEIAVINFMVTPRVMTRPRVN